VLRLLSVEDCKLSVSDLDIVDGTPVLDIKPYVAYTDAVAEASTGWLAQPVVDEGPAYTVEFEPYAQAQLAWLSTRSPCDVSALAVSVLRAGPAPHAYRRIRVKEGYSELAVKDFRVRFRTQGQVISVFEIVTGYRKSVLADERAQASELTPLAVHREFVATFGHAR